MCSDGNTTRVLHVDDDAEFAAVTADYIEREHDGFAVETANDPATGLERVRAGGIDCVVSDYRMPRMDGIEFFEVVREVEPDLPFVLFTGEGSESVASEAISAGVTDYLQKSTGTDQYAVLVNRVENAVAAARARDRAARQERTNALIRGIHRRLVEADGVAAIERAVCEAFADSELYRFAWIGHPDSDTGEIVPRCSAGDARAYLEEMTVRCDGSPRGRGPAGRAARTGALQVANAISEDPSFEPWRAAADRFGFESVAVLPLSADDGLHDVLAVYAADPHAFDETERDVLAELADTVGEAVERERTLEQLHGATRELLEAESKTDVASMTVDAVRDTLGYPNNLVRLHDEDDGVLRPAAVSAGAETMLGDRPAYPVGEGTAGRAFADGETLVLDDVQTVDDGYDRKDARASMYVPIGEYGTLSIGDTAAGVFDESDVHLAEIFAANAEAALDRVEQAQTRKRQNERLEEFTSVVSHDLRNPLSVLEASLPLAEETGEREHFDRCHRAVDRMERLIDDLLTLAREGESVDAPTPVSLRRVVEEAWNGVRTGDATVSVETDAILLADESRLQELVENLVRNSVEHGGAVGRPDAAGTTREDGDGAVSVTVGDLEDRDGFYVADDGPGIPPEERERVFESGFSTTPGGTGFGLSIVVEIATAHGWNVSVGENERSGGARFEISGVEYPT